MGHTTSRLHFYVPDVNEIGWGSDTAPGVSAGFDSADALAEVLADKDQANGYAGLDGAGLLKIIIARLDLTALANNIPLTTVYNVPVGKSGSYRVSTYTVITQAAGVSSALPYALITWVDQDTGQSGGAASTGTNTANAPGQNGFQNFFGTLTFNALAGHPIQIQTFEYASSGSPAMQYAVHCKVECLGV
jgi:hypothetical protein